MTNEVAGFDIGGTLTEGSWLVFVRAINDRLRRYGIERSYKEADLRNAGSSYALWLEKLAPETLVDGKKASRKDVSEYAAEVNGLVRDYVKPVPHVIEVVRAIKEHGDLVYIASISDDSTVQATVDVLGIGHLVDGGLTGITPMSVARKMDDELGSDPNGVPFYKARALHGFAEPRRVAAMVGDAESDIFAGTIAGARKTILIRHDGYRPQTKATAIVHDLKAVLAELYG